MTSLAGAYWLGDEKNPQLQRIYGTAFFSKKDLDEHFARLEEAAKRDHRVLGKQLDLFSIQDPVFPQPPVDQRRCPCRMYPSSFFSGGRSFTLVILPSDPMPPSCSTPSLRQHLANLRPPEAEAAMRLERRDIAQDRTAVQEERPTPLHLFHHIRAGFMDQPAQMRQHRLGKRRCLRDIGVDLWVRPLLAHDSSLHIPSPGRAPHSFDCVNPTSPTGRRFCEQPE